MQVWEATNNTSKAQAKMNKLKVHASGRALWQQDAKEKEGVGDTGCALRRALAD